MECNNSLLDATKPGVTFLLIQPFNDNIFVCTLQGTPPIPNYLDLDARSRDTGRTYVKNQRSANIDLHLYPHCNSQNRDCRTGSNPQYVESSQGSGDNLAQPLLGNPLKLIVREPTPVAKERKEQCSLMLAFAYPGIPVSVSD